MAAVIDMKVQGKAKADSRAVQASGLKAKGSALATVVVAFCTKEAKEEEARGQKRLKYIADIKALAPEGHAAFRAELQQELATLTELEKTSGIDSSRHGGYSMASFRVMVSNWRTISVACEAGMEVTDDNGAKSWERVLDEAREARKAQQALNGEAEGNGMRKQGAGRKAKTAYEKAFDAITKLEKKDQRRMLDALAASFHATVSYPEPKAKTVRPAGRKDAALAAQAAVLH